MDKTTPTAEFRIPVDLLKAFTNEVRFVPQIPHNNGYIIFDIDMLTSVLRRGDPKAGAALADHLDALKRAQGQLVVMQKVPEQLK
ncbi:MAG: hypothetical protein LAN70_14885 [Acidobacteriia bacterium]|nr:hypothetical protein [Terriglobia bacterium]